MHFGFLHAGRLHLQTDSLSLLNIDGLATYITQAELKTLFTQVTEALSERNQSPMADYERVEYDPVIAQVRSLLTEAEFNARRVGKLLGKNALADVYFQSHQKKLFPYISRVPSPSGPELLTT